MNRMTVIEIRPHRFGWQCFEAPGVQPYWVEAGAKQTAIDYAAARMKGHTGEIRIYDSTGEVARTLTFTKESP